MYSCECAADREDRNSHQIQNIYHHQLTQDAFKRPDIRRRIIHEALTLFY